MQLRFFFDSPNPVRGRSLAVGDCRVPVDLVRNKRARRYVLRLRPDGSARVTIPRGGSAAEAWRFVERHASWIQRQLRRLTASPPWPREWVIGTEIYFRGEPVRVEALEGSAGEVRFGLERMQAGDIAGDLRPVMEKHLWSIAARELPSRVLEFAELHRLPVKRVCVRNQRSRWGSCSRRGTVSLNWRLIQAPPGVRDYIILHELMHLKEMNHSARFWREVERACPGYEEAERWLKNHSDLFF